MNMKFHIGLPAQTSGVLGTFCQHVVLQIFLIYMGQGAGSSWFQQTNFHKTPIAVEVDNSVVVMCGRSCARTSDCLGFNVTVISGSAQCHLVLNTTESLLCMWLSRNRQPQFGTPIKGRQCVNAEKQFEGNSYGKELEVLDRPVLVCENGGTLTPSGTCDCDVSYTGVTCEQLIQVCGGPAQECLTSPDGATYRGTMTSTQNGYTCQRWDAQTPHVHTDTDPADFPDQTLECAANYCRNPGGARAKPGCPTTNQFIPWDFCNVPSC